MWPTCHGCWEAVMGPRLGSPLHDPYDGLDAESLPLGTVFGGAAPLTKPVKIKLQSGERGPCWQQACSFLASGDHFWPCQGSQAPASTGAAAFSRTCKRATTLPTGVGGIRTCMRVSVAAGMSPEKIKMRPGRRPGVQQKSGKTALFPAGSETRLGTNISSVTE